MAIDIDYYRKISGSYGTNSKQECQRDSLAGKFTMDFNGSIAMETVLVNNVSKQVIIQKAGIQNNIREIHKITMKPGDSISVGDIIIWNSVSWLCVQSDNVHGVYEYGNIQECKSELKYYDINHTLYTKPYVVYSGRSDEDEGKYITLASDEFILYCRNETDTNHINLNTRFILLSEPYRVIGINKLSKFGLLEITVKKDQITTNDNISLSIADYGLNQIIKSIVIKNGDSATLLYQNTTLPLVVECRNDGVMVSSPVVSYVCDNSYVATVSNSGIITAIGTGEAIITCSYGNVSATITITSVMSVVDDYNIVISPVDSSVKTGRLLTLTAFAMNNGVENLIKHFTWSLVNTDGSNNIYATIIPNDKTCVLTAKSFANKYIIVRASLTDNSAIYTDKEIKIINLF